VRNLFKVLTIIMMSVSSLSVAQAAGEDLQVVHIMLPKTDIQIKIETVLNAKEYVDMVTYHHDSTPSSIMLFEAMRLASLRGVKVRYFYDQLASSLGTPISDSYFALLIKAGVEIHRLDLKSRLKKWGAFDMVHSKWLLADAGDREHSVAILSGRNVGDRYVNWVDNTYAFRLKANSDHINQLRAYVSDVFSSVNKLEPKFTKRPTENMMENEAELRREIIAHFGTDTTAEQSKDFVQFVREGKANLLPQFGLNASEVRFVTSGVLQKKNNQPYADQIQASFDDILKTSKSVEYSTILTTLTKGKEASVTEFLKKGGNFNFITNGHETLKSALENNELLARSASKMQEETLTRLSKHGFLPVHTLNAGQFIYYHAKFTIGDSGVLLTSSNMNYSSDVHAEESGFYIKNPGFTKYMKKYVQKMKQDMFTEYDYENGQKLSIVERSCSVLLRNIF
jgi:phosphatidylserine/phosphatidylglycerophosphate/cardiolipin synthase-like enzyme